MSAKIPKQKEKKLLGSLLSLSKPNYINNATDSCKKSILWFKLLSIL